MTRTDSKSGALPAPDQSQDDPSSGSLLERALRRCGPEAIREIVNGLQTIRYGSILLTLHEGQLVEISKTIRIRPSSAPDGKPQ